MSTEHVSIRSRRLAAVTVAALLLAGVPLRGLAQDAAPAPEGSTPSAPPQAAAPQPSTKPPAKPKPKPKPSPSREQAHPAAASPPGPVAAEAPPKPPTTAPPPPASPPQAEPIQAPVPQGPGSGTDIGGEAQPLLHARNAGIATCMDTIVAQSATVIDSSHAAMSVWNSKEPNTHLFSSTVGLSYNNKAAPNGVALITAAPTAPNRCEGQTVQVYASVQTCSQIQASLIKTGRTIATLRNLPVVETTNGFRTVLMPTAGNGCVLISIGLR